MQFIAFSNFKRVLLMFASMVLGFGGYAFAEGWGYAGSGHMGHEMMFYSGIHWVPFVFWLLVLAGLIVAIRLLLKAIESLGLKTNAEPRANPGKEAGLNLHSRNDLKQYGK